MKKFLDDVVRANPEPHMANVIDTWAAVNQAMDGSGQVRLDGDGLKIGDLVAVAQHDAIASVDRSHVIERVNASIEVLKNQLSHGQTVYGVNTGFGGSADVRTTKVLKLQGSLVQFLNAGILLPSDKGLTSRAIRDLKSHALPTHIAKATILVRCNSLLRGHSGVRIEIIDALLNLLKHDLTPVIPLRGSISASGDLIPLSYIVGVLQGNPDIYVDCGPSFNYQIVSADVALRLAGMSPVVLGPKEGLGLLNGTATSCAFASFAMYHAQQLAVLTQVITAMSVEALRGHAGSFDPFIGEARPHPGQIEVAKNVLDFLSGSKLCIWKENVTVGLAQDRYALRTASQWIGPQLEDMMLAEKQITTELNSTTDNPLIDTNNNTMHHGGNFQAVSITSAMEKTRLALQMLGKIIFAQSQELVNPVFNNGLPPNLVYDDPSLSFTFKGADITMSAYMSELAYLANPVSSHVHSAEMHNQAVNSLALVSARYTMEAVEVISHMCATYLYELLQALDLRVLGLEFEEKMRPNFVGITCEVFRTASFEPIWLESLWTQLVAEWTARSSMDLIDRCAATANATQSSLLNLLATLPTPPSNDIFSQIQAWKSAVTKLLEDTYNANKIDFESQQPTVHYLGTASRVVYTYVRKDLKLAMHKGFAENFEEFETDSERETCKGVRGTVGSRISVLYESIRDGGVVGAVLGALKSMSLPN